MNTRIFGVSEWNKPVQPKMRCGVRNAAALGKQLVVDLTTPSPKSRTGFSLSIRGIPGGLAARRAASPPESDKLLEEPAISA